METATADIVDYAMPLMKIERMAKDIHNLCLEGKYKEALEINTLLGVEARMLYTTLRIMMDKDAR